VCCVYAVPCELRVLFLCFDELCHRSIASPRCKPRLLHTRLELVLWIKHMITKILAFQKSPISTSFLHKTTVLLRGQSLYCKLVHPHFQSGHLSQHLHIVQVLQSVSPFNQRTKTDSKSSNSSGIVSMRDLSSVHLQLEYQQLSVDNTC
jgi:hypothetical protein